MASSPVTRVQVPGQLYFQVLPCQHKAILVKIYRYLHYLLLCLLKMENNIYFSIFFWHSSWFGLMGCSSLLLWPLLPQVLMEAWEKGVNPEGNSTNPSNWDFSNSFFFAGTVVTTIGEVLSFLTNWSFLQLSCKAPRNVHLLDRIHLQDNLDSCGLQFSISFQSYLLFLCIQHISPAKKAECLLGTCNIIMYMHSSSWGCFEALSYTHQKIRDI